MLGALLRKAVLEAANKALSEGKLREANQKLWFIRCVATTPRPHELDHFGVAHFAADKVQAHQLALDASHSY